MALLGGAVLAIWNDVAPGGDGEFDHWHSREHVPERVGVPGFLRGRRYVAMTGRPKYFTLYETETLETLGGGAYVERLNNPTPWTSRVLPLFRNNNRSACRVTLTLGRGVGGTLATVRLGPLAARETDLRAWLTATALPALAEQPGVVGAHLCEADLAATRVPTEEKKLRDGEDEVARWVVLVESGGLGAIEDLTNDILNTRQMGSHGVAGDAAVGVYRLLYSLSK